MEECEEVEWIVQKRRRSLSKTDLVIGGSPRLFCDGLACFLRVAGMIFAIQQLLSTFYSTFNAEILFSTMPIYYETEKIHFSLVNSVFKKTVAKGG